MTSAQALGLFRVCQRAKLCTTSMRFTTIDRKARASTGTSVTPISTRVRIMVLWAKRDVILQAKREATRSRTRKTCSPAPTMTVAYRPQASPPTHPNKGMARSRLGTICNWSRLPSQLLIRRCQTYASTPQSIRKIPLSAARLQRRWRRPLFVVRSRTRVIGRDVPHPSGPCAEANSQRAVLVICKLTRCS